MTPDDPDRSFGRRAFVTLFLILAAHSMTETARDALFLSRLPITQLPWMYLLVAIASVLVARATTVVAASLRHAILPALLVAAAAISCALWTVGNSRSAVFLYLLYLWPGVFSSVVVVEFWRAVSDAYTITEAKSVFGRLGAAGTAGAALGSGAAVALSTWFPTTALLLTAALLLATAGVFSPAFPPYKVGAVTASLPTSRHSAFNLVTSNRYLRAVAVCLFLATVTATFTDFLFKGILTRDLPPQNLARVFASVSLVVSVTALLAQVVLVGPLLRRLGVTRSLVVLPAALSLAAGGLVGGAGLAGAIVVRITDGTLRYSVHRAISDLLYVPLTPGVRARAKALIDVLSQRAGQVVGSVTVLVVLSVGGGYRVLATGMLLLAVATIVEAVRLRQPYLDLFRTTLKKAGTETRLAYPSLDLGSLTSLVAAFSSDDERMVVAAMDLVAEEHEVQVIPVVMLFHPSRQVVLRTLELFEQYRREGFAWALDRLRRESDDPHIKAAALSAYATQRDEPSALQAGLHDRDDVVRMAALIGLISGGWLKDDDATRALAGAATGASVIGKEALAMAIGSRPSSLFEETLVQLAETADLGVRMRVAEAMARLPSPRFLPALRSMLSESALREPARTALVAVGKPALDFLAASLDDDALARTIRMQLPRSISRFEPVDAIPVLWGRLLAESDDLIQFKILRGVGRLVADLPEARPDREAIARAIDDVTRSGLRFAGWRAVLETAVPNRSRSDTETILIQLLAEKQARATESIFRLLGLSHPTEDFERIYRGLHGNRMDRASGLELLENAVRPTARETVLALLDDSADPARLAHIAGADAHRGLTRDETLAAIVRASSGVLQAVAVRHAAEVGLVSTN